MGTWGDFNTSKVEVKKPAKRRRGLGKGRTSRTNHNKLRDIKSFYEGLFKRSQKLKQSKKYPKRTKYFCDRFSTFDSYLKYYPIKKVTTKE